MIEIKPNKPFKIYPWGDTDGYRTNIIGYAETLEAARSMAVGRFGNYGTTGVEKWAIKVDGKTYILESAKPIILDSDVAARELLKANALKKLTAEEIEILGLK